METVPDTPAARPTGHGPPGEAPHHPRRVLALAWAVACTPVAVATARAAVASWLPASDLAYLSAEIRDVGGAHTPLTGAYSRLGFDHPGPLEAWFLAPLSWLTGGDPRSMLVGAGIVSALAIAVALRVAQRRGGTPLLVITTIVVLALGRGLSLDESGLVDPWNPTITVLPLLAAGLLAWDVAAGRARSAPVLALAASWTMQAHAGAVPVTAWLVVAAVVGLLVGGRRRGDPVPWRPLALAAAVGLVSWIGPLVDQIAGTGNLTAILAATGEGDRPVGVGDAGALLASQLRPDGPWLGATSGLDPITAALEGYALAWLLVPVGSLVLAATIGVRVRRDLTTLAAVLAVALAASWFAMSRITGPPFPYLVQWSWAVAALVAIAGAWACWLVVGVFWPEGAPRAGAIVAGVATVALLAASVAAAATGELPNGRMGVALATLDPPLAVAVGELAGDGATVGVDPDGEGILLLGPGVQMALERRGIDVCELPPPPDPTQPDRNPLREGRVCDGPVDVELVVAADPTAIAAVRADPGLEVVAEVSSLDPDDTAELAALDARISEIDRTWAAIARRGGDPIPEPWPGAPWSRDDMARLLELREEGVQIVVAHRRG